MFEYDYLTIDIGSTYTKQRLFKDCNLEDTVQTPTTTDNIFKGIGEGQAVLLNNLGKEKINARHILASSSAAGGLRMVAMGYMVRVTAKAAKEVAMNSGAKILEIVSHEVEPEQRVEILREIDPDIILLAGGTDYGDESSIIENAELITESGTKAVVVVAGNIAAQEEVSSILRKAAINHVRVRNIMPTIHELRVKEARNVIHQEFIKQIIKAQGIDLFQNSLTSEKIVPTPGAVLIATELLAKGVYKKDGIGGVIVVDLGGATTDIHSVMPDLVDLSDEERGLIVSDEKQMSHRTVEGNLGMRISATGVISTMDPRKIFDKKSLDYDLLGDFTKYCHYVEKNPDHIASNDREYLFDTLIAEMAVEIALKRHAGYIAREYDPISGIMPGMPVGRDLRKVDHIIGVGGIFSHRPIDESRSIIANALSDIGISLLPKEPKISIDKDYVLYTGGIISEVDQEYAYDVINKYIINRII